MKKLLRGDNPVVNSAFVLRNGRSRTMSSAQNQFKFIRFVRRTTSPATPSIVNIANAQGHLRELTGEQLKSVASRSGKELVSSLGKGDNVEI
jgi:hypothetical protein